jgi:hypothetical protein
MRECTVPRIEASVVVELTPLDAFAVSQTYGEVRYRWDTFVREQHLQDGAVAAAKGVRTWTRSRHGLVMVSEYVTFSPPSHVGMRMVTGPWFFSSFSGGWNFSALDDGTTNAVWRYNFTCRPAWLRRIADPIGRWLLGRDIRKRIAAFGRACADPELVAIVREQWAARPASATVPPPTGAPSTAPVQPDAGVADDGG